MEGAEMIQRNITFDFSRSAGKMKPVGSVNSCAVANDRLRTEMTEALSEMGVTSVRTHRHPSGSVVDISTVFPCFELDERFEASFNFAPTDKYLLSIRDAGAEILLRLGESREVLEPHRHNKLPENAEKWASVCERIIAHYNEGWANGFKLGIKQVEIMCDVDDPDVITHSPRVYYDFYRIVANRLRARFPRIKLGAYSSLGFGSLNHYDASEKERAAIGYLEGFLEYVTARDTCAPLDFFSWKCLAETPEELSLHSSYARNYLLQYGLKRTASVVSEFNLVGEDNYFSKEYPARLIASLILAQKSDISMLFYSSANPEDEDCALFSIEDRRRLHKTAAYRAMCCFGSLTKMKNTVTCTEDYRHTIYSLGTTDGTQGAILLCTADYNGVIELAVNGASFSEYSIMGIIGGRDRGEGYSTNASGVKLVDNRIRMRVGSYEVYFISLK